MIEQLSVRVYRILLYAYPAEFRRAWHDEMTAVFRDTCRDTSCHQRRGGLLALWPRTLVDLLCTAIGEHMQTLFPRAPYRGHSITAVVVLTGAAALGIHWFLWGFIANLILLPQVMTGPAPVVLFTVLALTSVAAVVLTLVFAIFNFNVLRRRRMGQDRFSAIRNLSSGSVLRTSPGSSHPRRAIFIP